jgi:hypothetical protein
LYRTAVLSDADLAKTSIQQCEQSQDGDHLAPPSLDGNNDKRQLSLNDVAFTEYLRPALLKSTVAVCQ